MRPEKEIAMRFLPLFVCAAFINVCAFAPAGADAAGGASNRIELPAPVTTGGKPLMDALAARSTNRNFADKPLPEPVLSNLLWATWGVNRPDGRRTAPTALNKQQVRVYVAMENGVWLYDGAENALMLVLAGDTRALFGGAPLTLLYAVPVDDEFGRLHAGALLQNAGLFCASEGLANAVKRTGADALDGKLSLPEGYRVVIIQSVGYPR